MLQRRFYSVYLVLLVSLLGLIEQHYVYAQASGSTWTATVEPVGSTDGTADGYGYFTPTGGIPAATVSAGSSTTSTDSSGSGSIQTVDANYRITLTWQPKNNNILLDPAPGYAVILYKRTVRAESSASATTFFLDQNTNPPPPYGPTSATGQGEATASCEGLSVTSSSSASSYQGNSTGYSTTGPKQQTDSQWKILRVTTTGGKAVFDIPYTLQASGSSNFYCYSSGTHGSSGGGTASFSVEYKIARTDMGRHNGLLGTALEGIQTFLFSDPSYTRWLPLAFTPTIGSSPFRRTNGSLPDIWGNMNCAYSLSLWREKNPDINGAGNFYSSPDIGANLIQSTKSSQPQYVLLDANGDRLVFNTGFAPLSSDIKSTLSGTPTGFVLSNAGPPGNLKKRGRYTYRFENFPGDPDDSNNPEPARLTSIEDAFGNKHLLAYSNDPAQPYLTVTDTSSYRQLHFYISGGYISRTVAPVLFGTTPVVRTQLLWDGAGHLTGLDVHLGNNTTVIQQVRYEYLTNSDVPIKVQQNGSVIYNQYTNSPAKDVFGNTIRRIHQITYGEASDTSSSPSYYPGAPGPSVQGTITFSYGSHSSFFSGIDARTNTITDARGYATKVTYHYANPDNGADNGAISGIDIIAPTLTGASSANIHKYRYGPDITQPTSAAYTDPLNYYWQAQFHPDSGNITEIKNPLNQVWSFSYGGSGGTDLLLATDPMGIVWSFGYTPQGRLSQVTDNAGRIQSQFTYNSFGQLATASVPAAVSATGQQETLSFHYDSTTGDLIHATDGDVTVLTGVFDLSTRTVVPGSAYSDLGDVLGFTVFPDTGDPQTTLMPLSTTILYNAVQAPMRITGPNGSALETLFNNGAVTGFRGVAPGGATLAQVQTQRDTRGRVYAVSDLIGSLFQIRYDSSSNPVRLIDGRGNQTTINYGPADEVTFYSWPGGGSVSMQYTAAGQVRQITDERSIVTQFQYDPAGRLTNIQLPATPAQSRLLTYDNAGRITSITNSSGDSVSYSYSATDKRLAATTVTHGGFTYTIGYTYNGDGTLASMTSPVGTTTYAYDVAKNLNQVINPHGETTLWTFDKMRRVTGQSSSGLGGIATSTTFTYGNTGQSGDLSSAPLFLRQIQHHIGGQPVWRYHLTRSYLGQILLQESGAVNGGIISSTDYENSLFAYDGRGRLISQSKTYQSPGVSSTSLSDTYTYDLANNLNAGGNGWNYNTNNQVTGAPARPLLVGASTFTQDLAGNVTCLGDKQMQWAAWGQMVQVAPAASGGPYYPPYYPPPPVSGPTVTYTYDLLGRRATKSVDGVLTARYLYDGALLIAEANSAGQITRSYTWGIQGLVSDRTLTGTPQSRFYQFDPSGSLDTLVGSSNTVLWAHGRYAAFGRVLATTTAPTPFAWKGQFGAYTDSDTGFVQMGVRDYSPAIGRFLSRDPSGYASGANLYAYCVGDPVNLVDIDGYSPTLITAAGGAALGATIGAGTNAFLAWRNGASSEEIREAAFRGAINGGITGGAMGFFGPAAGACSGFGSAIGLGMAEGAMGNIVDQGMAALAGELDDFRWKTFFRNSVIGGITGGVMRGVGMLCFTADTPVQVVAADGSTTTKRIADVGVGEIVWSKNPRTGEISARRVLRTMENVATELVTVSLADAATGTVVEVLVATPEHPFFTVSGFTVSGMVVAGELGIGTQIVTRAGPRAPSGPRANLIVAKVERTAHPEGVRVHNLHVEKDQTYFVGTANGGAWVHNDCDFGVLAGKSATVTKKGLGIVEDHLAKLDHAPYNDAMIARLRSAMTNGEKISGADLSFYTHELSEATMMGKGMSYDAAHAAALAKYKVSPFSVYHPDVIQAMPKHFNAGWRRAWGLP